jgi:dTDP-4-amino-4,6-dideoxygalactose transaminase
MTPLRVPYTDFPQQYREERIDLLQAIEKVMEKGDFILGESVQKFEDGFAALCQTPHAIGVGSGTDALIIALKILGIQPGDEVITVPNSWISTASCIALTGAKPVFVDVSDDLNLDPEQLEQAITPQTKAIIPVHLAGRPAKMDKIRKIADDFGLFIIEDAAQAVGAEYQGKRTGAWGDIGCFSLHPLKNLNACGDGGVITCLDEKYAERIKLMRNHGLEDREHASSWGMCSRLDSLQAAILCYRLGKLEKIERKRRETAVYYNDCLSDYVIVPKTNEEEHHVYHTYIIQTEKRDALAEYLQRRDISVKVHYPIPIHLQKAAEYLGYHPGDFPNTERLCKQILTLPIHQYLSEAQREFVVSSVKDFFGGH